MVHLVFINDNSPKNVVHRLIQPIRNTGRNVTIDNWFNSVPLSDELLNQKLTLLSPLGKIKLKYHRNLKLRKIALYLVHILDYVKKSSNFLQT